MPGHAHLVERLKRSRIVGTTTAVAIVAGAFLGNWSLEQCFSIFLLWTIVWQLVHSSNLKYREAYKDKDWARAISLCNEMIAKQTIDTDVYHILAVCYLNSKEPHMAIEACEVAASLSPNDPNFPYLIALAHHELEEFEAGVPYATKAVQLGNNHPMFLMGRCYLYAALYMIDDLINDCDAALQPNQAEYLEARALKALGLDERNQYGDAIQELNICLQEDSPFLRDPDYMAWLYALRADAYIHMGDDSSAFADLEEALKLKPDSERALFEKAQVHIMRKEPSEATAALDAVAATITTPRFIGIMQTMRCRIALLQDQTAEALDFSNNAVNCNPNGPYVLTDRGIVLLRSGDKVGALEAFNKAIQIHKYLAEAYYFRHEVHEAMGNKELAEADKKIALDYGYRPYL